MSELTYDVIVIGGGAGGLVCSIGAVKLGKKVLLIERRKMGGECTWSGCVPSKAFIQYSKEIGADKDSIFQKVRDISEEIYHHETPELLESYGIDVILGEASFKDSHTIVVNEKEYKGQKIAISTGTSPAIPPIKGLSKEHILTNDNFFLQEKLPKSVVFIGAGVITMELSVPLARLGVDVTILEKGNDIFGIAEDHVRDSLKETLKEYKIKVLTNVDIDEVKTSESESEIFGKQNNQDLHLKCEKIFVASGRQPNVKSLKLDNAGIKHSNYGIEINDYLQTSQSHIYALGDVTASPFRFSHVAGMQGEVFIRNMILPFFPKKYNPGIIPYVVFTDPEYAKVGMLEREARAKYGDNIFVYEYHQHDVERAVISLEKKFYAKFITHKGILVGASIVGAKAGEMAMTLQYIHVQKIPFRKLSEVMQAYPTYGDFIRRVSKRAMLDDLLSHPLVKLFRK